jgi:hypothetical protein
MLISPGIKLVIAMHDRYQLGCWGNGMFIPVTRLMRAVTLTHFIADTYVFKYKLPALDCAQKPAAQNDVTFFYQDSSPIFDFDNRLTHILQHKNQLLSGAPQWKDLSDYIFSFNIQNICATILRLHLSGGAIEARRCAASWATVRFSSQLARFSASMIVGYTILTYFRRRQRVPQLRHPRKLGLRNPRPRRHPLIQRRIRMAQQSSHRTPTRASRQEASAV